MRKPDMYKVLRLALLVASIFLLLLMGWGIGELVRHV